jgi:hypothetical protein
MPLRFDGLIGRIAGAPRLSGGAGNQTGAAPNEKGTRPVRQAEPPARKNGRKDRDRNKSQI